MTPDEQHAWNVIKALFSNEEVHCYWGSKDDWVRVQDPDVNDIRDIINHPTMFRIAKEEQP